MDIVTDYTDPLHQNTQPHYESPRVISLTKQQILEEFGPARALGSSGNPPCQTSDSVDCDPLLGGTPLP